MADAPLHTLLGAGGSIGTPLMNELLARRARVRLVSRRGVSHPGAESFRADLTRREETVEAVRGSSIAYLLAGLPYRASVWEEQWPAVMSNTIEACKSAGAALIFLDNVYMYGRVDGPMTEKTPYNPCSRKGEVRARIARQLEEEMTSGALRASIARAADFYGPHAERNAVPHILVLDNLMAGKPARWLADASLPHSLAFTLDSARGMALLGERPEALGQNWHLPTSAPPIDGKTFVELAAKEIGVAPSLSVLRPWMVRLAGLFNSDIAESVEMLYQSEREYRFDSTKFNEAFGFTPTPYAEGVRKTIAWLKRR
ncbi:MAG: NAD-dependent epimerase/dehydratase family protein [Thermoanaerobaculia bacterium]